MEIKLDIRTEKHVEIYFNKTNNETIRKVLPQKAQSVHEAIEDYRKTLLPNSTSYGKIILADGKYVGDVWCYCMDLHDTPNAMLSYCIMEPFDWNQGIATRAVALFLQEIRKKFGLRTVGAFTYSDNAASRKVLEKNGFTMVEEFTEDGIPSMYFEICFEDKQKD